MIRSRCALRLGWLTVLTAAVQAGCSPAQPELTPPEVLVSPYGLANQPLWAVAPLRNESGTSTADVLLVSDALVARINEVRGLSCVPMNRTLAAMRALRMPEIRSAEDALLLAEALGVDAILAGSLTVWDPYDPPKIGLALGLYPSGRTLQLRTDPRSLQLAARDGSDGSGRPDMGLTPRPWVVVSDHLDAANHGVLWNVRRYAEGRHHHDTALGWRRYTASMDLYTDFAAYWGLYRILQEEQIRLAQPGKSR
jgi:hypothetical protein